ncbi:hypothetical protein ACEVN9_003528 [Acinetobacter baumannii]
MTSTYLKLDVELPTGNAYKLMSEIALPLALSNLGGVVRGYRFTSGLADLTGDPVNPSQVVGNPSKVTDGYSLGNAGYIDTGVKETREFLWCALVRVSSGGSTTPIITSFVEAAQSNTGKSLGCNLAKITTAVKMSDASDSASTFTASNLTAGNWALIALSRRIANTTYDEYNFACKPAGVALQKTKSNPITPVTNSTSNICIGWAAKSGSLIPNASTIMNFASVHNKGLDATQLETLMNNLVTELATQDIIL